MLCLIEVSVYFYNLEYRSVTSHHDFPLSLLRVSFRQGLIYRNKFSVCEAHMRITIVKAYAYRTVRLSVRAFTFSVHDGTLVINSRISPGGYTHSA